MTMRIAVNAHLCFGLVNVPVGVSPSTNRQPDVRFTTLHAECGHPIKQDRFCPTCGSEHLLPHEMAKGYEVTKGVYVTFTEAEFNALNPERSNVIEVESFVGEKYAPMLKSLETQSYWLVPNEAFVTHYASVKDSMVRTAFAGVGKCSLWGKEHGFYLHVEGDALMLSLIMDPTDLVTPDFAVPAAPTSTVDIGVKLLKAMEAKSMRLSRYMPTRNADTIELIQQKMAGHEIEPAPEVKEIESTFDFQKALKDSIAAIEQPKLTSLKVSKAAGEGRTTRKAAK